MSDKKYKPGDKVVKFKTDGSIRAIRTVADINPHRPRYIFDRMSRYTKVPIELSIDYVDRTYIPYKDAVAEFPEEFV